jgi:hypothetical protein
MLQKPLEQNLELSRVRFDLDNGIQSWFEKIIGFKKSNGMIHFINGLSNSNFGSPARERLAAECAFSQPGQELWKWRRTQLFVALEFFS